MTAALEEKADEKADASEGDATAAPVASWLARAGALAVDVLPGLGVVVTAAVVALTVTAASWLWWLAIVIGGLVLFAMAVNRLLLSAVTGWSLGRCLFRIAVVRRGELGAQPSPWRLLARDLAHLLDTAALFIGWLWPLWDSRHRTFADLVVRTEVRPVPAMCVSADGHHVERPRNVSRLVGGVLAAAVVLSAAGAGCSYATVYRHARAIEDARAQIQEQGPRIVEEMLSYGAGSMSKDFAHARTLVTDGYRRQLVAQQQAVQKAGAMTNEYWVVNSAVLSVTPDTATMLMAMQGQRQASQQPERFITATTRVSFQKSPAGNWRVSDLTVLTKPVLNPDQGGGK